MARLAILLHMHQPDYRHPVSGAPVMPWTRLHALRGYRDVPLEVLEQDVDVTINLVPSLLDQLLACADGVTDPHLELTRIPARELRPEQAADIRRTFVCGHPAMVEAHPRYMALRERNRSADRLPVDALRDLQVWSTLAWFGATAVRDHPVLEQLRRKGSGFDEADKEAMLAVQAAVLTEVPQILRRLASHHPGRISTSPYYHPILPLLVDTAHARRCMPDLPDDPGFRHPGDASLHLRLARERMAEVLGVAPRGLWPSEGSVSPEVVELARAEGFRWLATDEEVLSRSTTVGPHRSGPWDLGGGMIGYFRDHQLSDRIGFQYARWSPADAVADLLGAATSRAHGGVLLIALDGENPWESWADAGWEFRRRLFEQLRRGPLQAITLDEAAEYTPVGRVRELHTGSWIGADFRIWIGHTDDRTAWRHLAEAREAIEAEPDPERRRAALDQLLPAEGSDWMWWYGDEFDTPFSALFDQLFRERLRRVWEVLGRRPPEALDRRIGGADAPRVTPPLQLLDPRLEPEPRWIHWAGAGQVRWPALGSMARGGGDAPAVSYGWSVSGRGTALWLRFELGEARSREDIGAHWTVEIDRRRLVLPAASAGARISVDGLDGVLGPRDLVVRAPVARLPADEVPFALSLSGSDGVHVRYPASGCVSVPRPPGSLALAWWTV